MRTRPSTPIMVFSTLIMIVLGSIQSCASHAAPAPKSPTTQQHANLCDALVKRALLKRDRAEARAARAETQRLKIEQQLQHDMDAEDTAQAPDTGESDTQ